MTPEQIASLLASAPVLTVQGLLVLFIFYMLKGNIRAGREFDSMESQHQREVAAAKEVTDEIKKQRDKYEALAWEATSIANRSARAAEKAVEKT